MANKTVLKERKKSKVKGKSLLHIRWCTRLSIHSSFQKERGLWGREFDCITEFSELTRTPSRKYIYFWKTVINTAAKSVLVQLCYYMTREFSSTFSRINRQTSIPTEKCFKLAQKPCGRVGKRKYNLNGISTTLRRHFRWKLFAFSEVPGL